jgi:hypothetical protein
LRLWLVRWAPATILWYDGELGAAALGEMRFHLEPKAESILYQVRMAERGGPVDVRFLENEESIRGAEDRLMGSKIERMAQGPKRLN